MMEEGNGFFSEWGLDWLPYYQLLFLCLFMLVGPCLMCYQTVTIYQNMSKKRESDADPLSKPIEDDPEFEADEDAADEDGANEEEKTKGDENEEEEKKEGDDKA